MSGSSNMALWDMVSFTDPAYKKPMTHGARLTAVDSTYQAQRATEVFGPYGIGWGVYDIRYEIIRVPKDKLEEAQMIMQGQFWYRWEGKVHNMPIIVDLPFSPRQDTAKKCQTMLQSKGLAKLGFNADVRLNKFEDDAYSSAANLESSLAKEAEHARLVEKQQAGWAQMAIVKIHSCRHDDDLKQMKGKLDAALKSGKISESGYVKAVAELTVRGDEIKSQS